LNGLFNWLESELHKEYDSTGSVRDSSKAPQW
jgi:hypothetical protein